MTYRIEPLPCDRLGVLTSSIHPCRRSLRGHGLIARAPGPRIQSRSGRARPRPASMLARHLEDRNDVLQPKLGSAATAFQAASPAVSIEPAEQSTPPPQRRRLAGSCR
jgi:hypothetical protein